MSAASRLHMAARPLVISPRIGGGRASRGDAGDLVEVEGDGARAPRVRGKARVRFRARVRASVWASVWAWVRAGARVRVVVRVRVA